LVLTLNGKVVLREFAGRSRLEGSIQRIDLLDGRDRVWRREGGGGVLHR
jgi:hypothetical protein